jgi:hypothetical protein
VVQECYKSVTRVLQECYKSVTRVYPFLGENRRALVCSHMLLMLHQIDRQEPDLLLVLFSRLGESHHLNRLVGLVGLVGL